MHLNVESAELQFFKRGFDHHMTAAMLHGRNDTIVLHEKEYHSPKRKGISFFFHQTTGSPSCIMAPTRDGAKPLYHSF